MSVLGTAQAPSPRQVVLDSKIGEHGKPNRSDGRNKTRTCSSFISSLNRFTGKFLISSTAVSIFLIPASAVAWLAAVALCDTLDTVRPVYSLLRGLRGPIVWISPESERVGWMLAGRCTLRGRGEPLGEGASRREVLRLLLPEGEAGPREVLEGRRT